MTTRAQFLKNLFIPGDLTLIVGSEDEKVEELKYEVTRVGVEVASLEGCADWSDCAARIKASKLKTMTEKIPVVMFGEMRIQDEFTPILQGIKGGRDKARYSDKVYLLRGNTLTTLKDRHAKVGEIHVLPAY